MGPYGSSSRTGGETHTECGICANETKQEWAPARIWLQRGVGDDGSHTWCSDSQDEHEQAEYVRVDVKAPAVEALARDEREDFEAAMEKHGRMRPFTRWPSDDSYTDDRIEWARRGWLAALARASESAEVPAGYKLVPAEPTVEMLNAALPHDVTFGHGFKRLIYQEMIAAAPQPASEQQPIPQVFTDTGDAVRGTFGKTVFAEMSNSDDLWSVWLDGWLRASEQHAASGLSDDVRSRLEFYAACYCKSTSATDREAGKAMYALLAAKGDGQ
jgi:hypothetical protein